MSSKQKQSIIAKNHTAITTAYNTLNSPQIFKAFVSVNYLGDYTPPITFNTKAGILIDSFRNGIWIDFSGFEDRFYSEYSSDYQVFYFDGAVFNIECETKYGDKIRITINPE